MCSPMLLLAAGTLITAGGQYQQGEYANAIAKQNAKVSDLQYRDSLARGTEAEDAVRRETRRVAGAQRAAIGGSNLELSGTPLDLLTNTDVFGELDALRVRSNAAREAWGYQTQGIGERMQGRGASMAGRYGAAGTLLTGGSQAYGMWKKA